MLYSPIIIHTLETVITDGSCTCPIISVVFPPCTYLQKGWGSGENTANRCLFLLFEWKQSSWYNINDVSNCQKRLIFFVYLAAKCGWLLSVRFVDATVSFSSAPRTPPACSCCCHTSLQESDELYQPQINLQPHLFPPCNPGEESCTRTLGTWELVCTHAPTHSLTRVHARVHTHTHTHTHWCCTLTGL